MTLTRGTFCILIPDLLGKRVQRCRSLPSVALRSFLNGTQVTQNTARYELLLRACASTYGWKRSEGGRRGEDSYVKKLFMENILLADFTN